MTHRCEHTLALTYSAAASQEAYDDDEHADNDENVGTCVEVFIVVCVIHIVSIRVEAQPYSYSKNHAS